MTNPSPSAAGPLAGVRVIELGQLIAGPFCGKTLADFGAEVIKIEPPGKGDPLRKWRLLKNGNSVWWEVQSRNKQSVTLDLTQREGQDILRLLVMEADVLIENFRPGKMEEWGLGYEDLKTLNPRLVMARISGYGQDGPYRDRPGFGIIAESMGGLRYLTAEPGRVPVRVGVSIGDTLAALHAVIGILMALYYRDRVHRDRIHRDHNPAEAGPTEGQVVDVALYESVFNCMESLLPEYSAFNVVREAAGSALPGIVPSNAYPCSDGWILIGGNGDGIFKRLMKAIGREDFAASPDMASNEGRVKRVTDIDGAITAWTQAQDKKSALEVLARHDVPSGAIYSVADIAADAQYRARDMILNITTRDGYTVDVPGIVPKLSATPGGIRTPAPRLGEDTAAILARAGLKPETLADLRAKGVI
ncbi:MAG: CaiB/BaiF CoA transferase family protein [Betaproteobacteria bacterium]|jgi:formyl-CoA transferase|nr:CoA transferase [Betaproteobacteria bacterium]